jgi:hypothetical protein
VCVLAFAHHRRSQYAFEQGKYLKIPEVVPFRLTQNIVDGLGPVGTDGVFHEACVVALRALRVGCSVCGGTRRLLLTHVNAGGA